MNIKTSRALGAETASAEPAAASKTVKTPAAGGRYTQNQDGSVTLIDQSQTEQPTGRTKASREALDKRLEEGARGLPGATTTDTQE